MSEGRSARPSVVLVNGGWRRPLELEDTVVEIGYAIAPVEDLTRVPAAIEAGGVAAVIVGNRAMGLKDLLALDRCRTAWPAVPVIVVATDDTSPTDLKRALDHGASVFLSWPCSVAILRDALAPKGPGHSG